jgi:hypothetical protein
MTFSTVVFLHHQARDKRLAERAWDFAPSPPQGREETKSGSRAAKFERV